MLQAQASTCGTRRRTPAARFTEPFSIRLDKATAEALANVSARSGKARGWIIAELLDEGLKRIGALAEPTDKAA